MKSLFKKVVPFVFVISSVAVAAGFISKEAVNQKVAEITAPYNNENTKMEIKFTDLNVDSIRALDFGLKASVWKKGPENEVNLKLDNVQYHYGDGQNPTATGALSLKLDLVKAFGQPTLNSFAEGLGEIAQEVASTYGQKYGEAVTVDAKLEELVKDQQGNVVTAKLHVAVVIDFNKLPANLKVEDVEFKNIEAEVIASRGGVEGSVSLVLNSANKSFQQDQPGLKELVDKLLKEDAETYKSLQGFANFLNSLADSIVKQKAQQ